MKRCALDSIVNVALLPNRFQPAIKVFGVNTASSSLAHWLYILCSSGLYVFILKVKIESFSLYVWLEQDVHAFLPGKQISLFPFYQ
jgi:hypothetical protein